MVFLDYVISKRMVRKAAGFWSGRFVVSGHVAHRAYAVARLLIWGQTR